MITTVRRRQFDTRAAKWTGSNEAEVRELCPDFYAVDEQDRGDDPDGTGEGPFGPHGNRSLVYDGDFIVAWPGGGWRRYRPGAATRRVTWPALDDAGFEARHEPRAEDDTDMEAA